MSQERAAAAIKNGHFSREIIPIIVKGKKDQIFRDDEYPRNTSMEALGKLNPVFAGVIIYHQVTN